MQKGIQRPGSLCYFRHKLASLRVFKIDFLFFFEKVLRAGISGFDLLKI